MRNSNPLCLCRYLNAACRVIEKRCPNAWMHAVRNGISYLLISEMCMFLPQRYVVLLKHPRISKKTFFAPPAGARSKNLVSGPGPRGRGDLGLEAKKKPRRDAEAWVQTLTQLVALSAVRMALATEAMICTIHFMVSFFVISVLVFS